jgi:small subunit ribosomal protein S21
VDDWQAESNKFKRIMIIIDRKDGENIDRMLRRYKRKHRDIKLRRELRDRKQFEKPSDIRRKEVLKAIYRDQKIKNEEL